ncbi:hypothetical protein D3C72_1659060 [compost metagenome]
MVPMNRPLGPTSCGMMKSPRVRLKVKMEPATTPGKASGRMTWAKVCRGLAPRSAEACSSEGGRRSREAWIGRIMKGSQI